MGLDKVPPVCYTYYIRANGAPKQRGKIGFARPAGWPFFILKNVPPDLTDLILSAIMRVRVQAVETKMRKVADKPLRLEANGLRLGLDSVTPIVYTYYIRETLT